MNLFGKAKAAKTSPKDAIVKLRESLDMLEKREKFLASKIEAELKIAKQNATKNKRGFLDFYSFLLMKWNSCTHGIKKKESI